MARQHNSIKQLWIMPHPEGGWQGKHANKDRAAFITGTKEEAVARGRGVARKNKDELIITDKHNIIRQKDSSGNDPRDILG
ncbi:MAG: hypothetical protein ACD_37C00658G0004 [uncultured bacterium]|nr:MAG: hypothetical protein ACD_37C00658G0004 [uncultured bacterium]